MLRSTRNGGLTAAFLFSARARGFTLIELIVVMVLMAILTAVAAPRFFGSGDFEGPAFAQELASAARYAQKLAVTGGCPVQLQITSTTHYELKQGQGAPGASCDPAFTRTVLRPGSGDSFVANAPAGAVIGGTVPLTLQFDARGAPSIGGSDLAADLSIPVGSRTLRITARSGYVEVQ